MISNRFDPRPIEANLSCHTLPQDFNSRRCAPVHHHPVVRWLQHRQRGRQCRSAMCPTARGWGGSWPVTTGVLGHVEWAVSACQRDSGAIMQTTAPPLCLCRQQPSSYTYVLQHWQYVDYTNKSEYILLIGSGRLYLWLRRAPAMASAIRHLCSASTCRWSRPQHLAASLRCCHLWW